jgi:crotonobetainyl-CoA:carnitine CoA-transferase CaiB-like acyl-CoA transferase
MTAILQGLRVLELGQVLAGPFAGAILADLGAEVIKLERVDGGDDARHMGPPFRHGDALNFQVFNRGKQSVALDLKTDDGRAAFERLAADRRRLHPQPAPRRAAGAGHRRAALCARHPRLVYCGISAFGARGPMALRPGYEPLIQAFSGLSSLNGGPDDPPMRSGASVCDQGTGMWAVIGALALLQRRQHTGRGGVVAASLLETALVWNAQKADAFSQRRPAARPPPLGPPGLRALRSLRHRRRAAAHLLRQRPPVRQAGGGAGPPGLGRDERFASNRARLANKAALVGAAGAAAARAAARHLAGPLEAAGVPCAPVHTVPEALAHPQVQALGLLQPVPGEDFPADRAALDRRRPAPGPARRCAAAGRTQRGARPAGAGDDRSPLTTTTLETR